MACVATVVTLCAFRRVTHGARVAASMAETMSRAATQRMLQAEAADVKRTPGARSRIASSPSRDRIRTRNAGKREPLADQVPRPVKRTAGRAAAPLTPAHIRVDGVAVDDDDRAYIRRRLGEKLGKYASSIERVTVRVRDVNGPRGGVDLLCRIKVVLSGLPSIVVEHRATRIKPALTRALTGVERAVRQTVQRKRMRPIRSAASREVEPAR